MRSLMAWTKKHQKILNLIVEDVSAREYFFQTASSPLFLDPLSKQGFFSFESIPDYPESWFQYKYLTEVAKEIQEYVDTDVRYKEYIRTLLSILKYLVRESKNHSPEKILLVFECFCDIFKILPSREIPLVSINELISLCHQLAHLNLAIYHIKELIQKFLKDKMFEKAQKMFESFLPILLKSNVKDSDKNYFLQELGKFPFFIQGNKTLFQFLLNILSEQREPRNIIDYQFADASISLFHEESGISVKVIFKENTYLFSMPMVSYSDRNDIALLVCKNLAKVPKVKRIKIANEIKSLYYTHLWRRHYSINSLFSLEKEERYVYTVDEQLMLLVATILIQQVGLQSSSQFRSNFLKPLYSISSETGWRILLFFFGKMSPKYDTRALSFLEEHKELLFVDSMFEGEVFDLLSILASSCKGTKRERTLVDLVNKGPYFEFISHISKTINYKQSWKKKWLAALRIIPECDKAYQKLSNIPKEWINSRDAKSREIIYQSPFKQEYILEKADNNIEELIAQIREFDAQYKPDEKDFFHEKPSPEGLGETLQKATQKFPEIMYKLLRKNEILGIMYIEAILNGLRSSGKIINSNCWEFVYNYACQILPKIFLSSNYTQQQKDRIVIALLGIISTRYKEFEGKGVYLKAMDVVELIYCYYKNAVPSLEKNNYDSYLTAALNSVWGLLAQAIIGLSLRVAPTRNATYKNVWDKRAQVLYNKLLSLNIPESYVFLGFHYDCFLFLNKKWLGNKIKSIAQQTIEREYFFSGYIYLKVFFPNELQDFREDYHSLVQKEVFSSSTQEIAAERLVTLLIHQSKVEDAEDEIEWLVKHAYPVFLSYIAHSFHNLLMFGKYRIAKSEKDSKKIRIALHFWHQVFLKFEGKELTDEKQQLMKSLLSLLPFIPHMSQLYRNMLLASLKVCDNHPPIQFLDNLLKISQATPKDCKEFCGDVLNIYIQKFPMSIAWQEHTLLQLIDIIYEKETDSQHFQSLLHTLQEIHAHELAHKIAQRCNFKPEKCG